MSIQIVEYRKKLNSSNAKPRVSIIVPTFKHGEEPVRTIQKIVSIMQDNDELIIVDQNVEYVDSWKLYRDDIIKKSNVRILDLAPASTPLARNVGGLAAKADILLYLDDDMDVDSAVIENHLKYFEDINIGGVAGVIDGAYSVSSRPQYVKSAKGGNMSFRKSLFLNVKGFDTNINGNFSGEETEFCERIRLMDKRIIQGLDCLAFHRGPLEGGAGNQGVLTLDWYYKTYCNHFYWMLKRKGSAKFTRLPWHVLYLIRSFLPKKSELFSMKYIDLIFQAFLEGRKRAKEADYRLLCWDEIKNNPALVP